MRRSIWVLALCATVAMTGCGQKKLDMELNGGSSPLSAAKSAESNSLVFGGIAGGDGLKKKKQKLKTWKRSQVEPNMSRLKVGENDFLPLKGMQVNVQIDGFRARVVLDCFFQNTKPQQLEGTFQLRLPNEASLDFFAFGEMKYQAKSPQLADNAFASEKEARRSTASPKSILSLREETWNQPKVARVVPKDKAAFAYRQTVRRRVDPALAEWAGAGVFNARVFPLAPGKLHRVVVGYDVNLLRAGDDLVFKLDLPGKVKEKMVDIIVTNLKESKTELTPKNTRSIGGETWQHYRYANPDEDRITVRLTNPGNILLHANDPESTDFFATRFRPKIPAAKTAGSPRGVFLVDVSLSSNPERFNIWLKMLAAVLNNNRDSLKEFAVAFFNIDTFWWQPRFVPNTPENVAALIKHANGLALEGATNLQRALATATHPAWNKAADKQQPPDLFLLSDSAPTWGSGDLHALTQPWKRGNAGPLFAYTTGMNGTDTRVLAHLARESGGAVFAVVGAAQIKAASIAHGARPWVLDRIEIANGSDLMLAGRPKSVYPGQQLTLVGRGKPGPNSEVILSLRQGNVRREVRTRITQSVMSILTPRLYGQVAVGQLEEFKEATEEISAAYSRHFRISGQTCSLLMLDSEADYQRFNIKPQEDAFVVKSNSAGRTVNSTLEKLEQTLGDPKAELLVWLKRLEKTPGVKFELPTALRLAVESMPRESFEVASSDLKIQLRTWKGIPGDLQEQLASKKLIYDDLERESERRTKEHSPADGLLALSSLVENNPGDAVLARDVGYTALKWQLGGEAYHLFRRVSQSRPYEPQTYYAMARCLSQLGANDLAIVWYEVALAGQWDARFGALKKIVGLEYLRMLLDIEEGKRKTSVSQFAQARLKTLSSQYDPGKVDLIVGITWNTDGTDVDLHVTEPNGEECYYQHTSTRRGGSITQDVTGGFGPEMYTIRKSETGDYRVRVKYFASDANRTSTRTKVYVTIYQHWGSERQTAVRKVVTLRGNKEMHNVAMVRFK